MPDTPMQVTAVENIDHEVLMMSVTHCARCGRDHPEIVFTTFLRPPSDASGTLWSWWGTCPVSGDPILLRIAEVNDGPTQEG